MTATQKQIEAALSAWDAGHGKLRAAQMAAAVAAAEAAGWEDTDSAPRDGTQFLAWCIRRYPFSDAPTYFYDIAKWSGRTSDDRAGHFASRSGDIVFRWRPLPEPPAD